MAAVPSATSSPVERGVTPTSVQVGGLVAGDPPGQGADLGAKARFERANRQGRVGGRTISYVGASPVTDTTAAARLADEAFAVVPAVGVAQEATTFATERLPFVGVATSSRVVREPLGLWHHRGFAFDAVEDRESRVGCATASAARGLQGEEGRGRHRDRPVERDPSRGDLHRAPQGRLPGRGSAHVAGPADRRRDHGAISRRRDRSTAGGGAVAHDGCDRGRDRPAARGPQLHGHRGRRRQPLLAFGTGVRGRPHRARSHRADRSQHAGDPPHGRGRAFGRLGGRHHAGSSPGVLRRRLLPRRPPARRTQAHREGASSRRRTEGDYSYEVAGTIGRSTWPAMHTQGIPCGALVQGDGTQYFVAEPYRCDPPIKIKVR